MVEVEPTRKWTAQLQRDQLCHLKRHVMVLIIVGFMGMRYVVTRGLITMSLQPEEVSL